MDPQQLRYHDLMGQIRQTIKSLGFGEVVNFTAPQYAQEGSVIVVIMNLVMPFKQGEFVTLGSAKHPNQIEAMLRALQQSVVNLSQQHPTDLPRMTTSTMHGALTVFGDPVPCSRSGVLEEWSAR
jgi:hypothetical protein